MSKAEFTANDNLDISVEQDDETGAIIISILADDDEITINAGRFDDDAYQLHDELAKATKQALDIRDNWEPRPEDEDGYVFPDRGGYYAKLSGKQAGPFPSQDIATYELAHMMATEGYFPNSWWQDERGGLNSNANAVRAFHDEGGDKILPLPGVRYADGDDVLVPGEDWQHWVVDRDYGDLGVMVHTYGDPSVNMLATHDQLQPYDEDDEDEEQPRNTAENYQDGPCGDR